MSMKTEPVTYENLIKVYNKIKELEATTPPWVFEGIKVTSAQLLWLRRLCDTEPANPVCFTLPAITGTPIYVVDKVEESTPYIEKWHGWPGVS
jgi:hypothetical protein